MKRAFIVLLLLVFATGPAAAQSEDGSSLMERGAQQFLEGLLLEMEPAWAELQTFLEEMGPALAELMEEVKDWSNYEPPEILENGDIIIRRKPDLPAPVPDAPAPPAQIEL